MGCRWLRASGAAEASLDELVKNGWGAWEPSPAGQRGQPTRRFHLSDVSTVNGNGQTPDANSNTVDVDTVDAPETEATNDDWGEV